MPKNPPASSATDGASVASSQLPALHQGRRQAPARVMPSLFRQTGCGHWFGPTRPSWLWQGYPELDGAGREEQQKQSSPSTATGYLSFLCPPCQVGAGVSDVPQERDLSSLAVYPASPTLGASNPPTS